MTTTEHTCCAVYWEREDGNYAKITADMTEEEYCETSDATGHWCMYVNWTEYAVCQTGGIIVTVICIVIAVRTGQQFLLLLLHDSSVFPLASAAIADSCGWRSMAGHHGFAT